MGVPVDAAQHLPEQHPGPADLVRGARVEGGPSGRARRRGRPDGRDEPADLGRGRPPIVPGGYLFYDNTKPMPPSKFRDDIVVLGVPLHARQPDTYSCSKISIGRMRRRRNSSHSFSPSASMTLFWLCSLFDRSSSPPGPRPPPDQPGIDPSDATPGRGADAEKSGGDLTEAVIEQVYDRAGGVPLFVEEFAEDGAGIDCPSAGGSRRSARLRPCSGTRFPAHFRIS